jgi:bifunctional DNase/RNase
MKLVEIAGLHMEATTGAPLVLLREQDAPHRVLPIFVGGPEAAAIALAVSGQFAPRPSPHEVMAALVESLDAEVERIEVTGLHDGAFFAELAVSGPSGGRRLDTRPSDAIALAARLHAPLFVSDAVLDEAGTVLQESPDEEIIDDEVSDFRSFLDDVDPADFGTGTVPGPDPDDPSGDPSV